MSTKDIQEPYLANIYVLNFGLFCRIDLQGEHTRIFQKSWGIILKLKLKFAFLDIWGSVRSLSFASSGKVLTSHTYDTLLILAVASVYDAHWPMLCSGYVSSFSWILRRCCFSRVAQLQGRSAIRLGNIENDGKLYFPFLTVWQRPTRTSKLTLLVGFSVLWGTALDNWVRP